MSPGPQAPAGNFIILDVEATCSKEGNSVIVPRGEGEIIEIGALVVSPELVVLSEFSQFVRPVRHPVLSEFCTELTTITQRDVDGAQPFPAVARALALWAQWSEVTWWGSWGYYDRDQFTRDALHHAVPDPLPQPHVNIKEAFGDRQHRRSMGLGRAVRRAGLDFEGTAHRGIDDARNIVRLLPFVLGNEVLR